MPTAHRRKGRPRGFDSKPAQNTIQSLDRALNVLDALAASGGMTLTDLSENLDQSPATMYRVLFTLEARGIVETDPQTQEWHVGPMAFRLGSAFLRRTSVVERARPVMRRLMEDTGETSNLGIERGGEVMFLSQVETHHSIRAFFPPGTLSPMHASGIGKALLSLYDDDRIARLIRQHPLDRFTSRTLTTAEGLAADLARVRSRGYAIDDEEKTEGMRCVAAPVLNLHGEAVAGLSVSGPSHRLPPEAVTRLGALVRDAAQEVSRGLGAP